MTEAFAILVAAARGAAGDVEARPSDQSFLEATLEAEIARRLPGNATTAQGRTRFALEGFDPHPYGVDIDWRHDGTRAAIEVKVSDVLDSLFDVIKLATAIDSGKFDEAFCAVAATTSQSTRGGQSA